MIFFYLLSNSFILTYLLTSENIFYSKSATNRPKALLALGETVSTLAGALLSPAAGAVMWTTSAVMTAYIARKVRISDFLLTKKPPESASDCGHGLPEF
jgi:D-serine deaminase-like pyridoxal phosphate-dependent protein